ncbi:MAG: hypothetical protein ACK56I_22800, partial [bacterium]
MEPEDQWCELRMWRAIGVETSVELLGVTSGVAFFIVPLFDYPLMWTNLHCALYVALCYLGAGTIVYHTIPNKEVNGQALVYMMDYVPMVFT